MSRSDRSELNLVGRGLPRLQLESTEGPVDLRALGGELLVLFMYPHATGLPEPPVPGWDRIPGARGCTAQSCAFRDRHEEFLVLGAALAGLSAQPVAEQRAFAASSGLGFRLISDPEFKLASALGLPTFAAHGRRFYRRLTLAIKEGVITTVFFPVTEPEENAADVLRSIAGGFAARGAMEAPPS